MESVKLALMKRIEEAMPEVRIDEDYGQLESQEDQYPVVFPCVLVGMGDTEWLPMANRPGIQQGKTSVTLKLAIDCYDDTHVGSTTEAVAEDVRARPTAQHGICPRRRGQGLRGDVRVPRAGDRVIIPRRTGAAVRP